MDKRKKAEIDKLKCEKHPNSEFEDCTIRKVLSWPETNFENKAYRCIGCVHDYSLKFPDRAYCGLMSLELVEERYDNSVHHGYKRIIYYCRVCNIQVGARIDFIH